MNYYNKYDFDGFTADMNRKREESFQDPLRKRSAVAMDTLVDSLLKELKMAAGLANQIVFSTWDKISNVADYTISKELIDGVLYLGFSSSAVRDHVYFQLEFLLYELNKNLLNDKLYCSCLKKGQSGQIKKIVLR